MFIIYGTKVMKKDLGEQPHLFNCVNCNNLINYKLMSTWEWVTLFWIPIFPIGRKKYYSICPVCGSGYKHTKEEMEQILQNEQIEETPAESINSIQEEN